MSLRKFSDIGLSIYLDNKILKIYDKETNQIYLSGRYEKPNWLLEFNAQNLESHYLDQNYETYLCKAQIVSIDEFLNQSQTNLQNVSEDDFEIAKSNEHLEFNLSDIGRENNKELDSNLDSDLELFDSDQFIDSDFDNNTINRKIFNLNKINPEGLSENMFTNPVSKIQNLELKKISEGMLWHCRLGHASLKYLRQLQRNNEILKNAKFYESIKDYKICIMTKMENQPFKEIRTRADTTLRRIHSNLMGPIKLICKSLFY